MAATLGEAVRQGLSGLGRERWLVAVGLATALLRRALWLPATAVALLLLVRGAWSALELAPYSLEAPGRGMAHVATQPRALALVAGLGALAALLGWLLRIAYLAGALPVLAGAMGSEAERRPRFAAGVAWGLARLLPTALLGLAIEWTGQLVLAGTVLAALRTSVVAVGSGRMALAAAVAAALVLALLVALLTSVIADAALVRTAVRGDGPVEAVVQASTRVLARPSATLALLLGIGLVSLVTSAAIQSVGGLATGFATGAPAPVTIGPALMLAAVSATAAAALELWWLASLAVLAAREG